MPELPYKPAKVGQVYNMVKATVYGFAYHESTLIALSVQAPTVQAEQIHYQIQGQDQAFTVQLERVYGNYNRTAYGKKCHFEVVKNPIPDTSEVSLILLNTALYTPNRDLQFTYAWHLDVAGFKNELWRRVRDITYTAVLEHWADFLYMYGMNTTFEGRPLCGRLPNRADTKDWLSASFDIGFIRNSHEQWQKLISRGLEEGIISTAKPGEEQPRPKQVVKESGVATIYRTDGTSEEIAPKNGTDFKLEELSAVVDGMVEIVNLQDGRIIVLNEEGKLIGLPVNRVATGMFQKVYGNSDIIVGDVIVCKDEQVK